METYTAFDDRRARLLHFMLVSDTAAGTARHPEPAPRTDELVRLRVAAAVALPLSLGLWALVWFALTRLITNWP